jgi:hypothetical protein
MILFLRNDVSVNSFKNPTNIGLYVISNFSYSDVFTHYDFVSGLEVYNHQHVVRISAYSFVQF